MDGGIHFELDQFDTLDKSQAETIFDHNTGDRVKEDR